MNEDAHKVCQGTDGPCDRPAKRRRQDTAYVDDEMNWVVMCDECAKHNEEHWKSMWAEYYAGRI